MANGQYKLRDVKRQHGLLPKDLGKAPTTQVGGSPTHMSFTPFVDAAGGCVLKAGSSVLPGTIPALSRNGVPDRERHMLDAVFVFLFLSVLFICCLSQATLRQRAYAILECTRARRAMMYPQHALACAGAGRARTGCLNKACPCRFAGRPWGAWRQCPAWRFVGVRRERSALGRKVLHSVSIGVRSERSALDWEVLH